MAIVTVLYLQSFFSVQRTFSTDATSIKKKKKPYPGATYLWPVAPTGNVVNPDGVVQSLIFYQQVKEEELLEKEKVEEDAP